MLKTLPRICICFFAISTVLSEEPQETEVNKFDRATRCSERKRSDKQDCKFASKEGLEHLKKSINIIKFDCGEVCDTSTKIEKKRGKPNGKYVKSLQKKINCPIITTSTAFEGFNELQTRTGCHQNAKTPPTACDIPDNYLEDYLYGGRVELYDVFTYDNYGWPNDKRVGVGIGPWTDNNLEASKKQLRFNQLSSGVGIRTNIEIDTIVKTYMSKQVTDGRVLVLGGTSVNLEAIMLENWAKEIIHVLEEPQKNYIEDEDVTVVTPAGFTELIKTGKFDLEEDKFDAVISVYDLANEGMSRLMGKINPWGDLVQMARAWCLTKQGGRALIGLPSDKKDRVIFNKGRIYSEIQLSHLFSNWKQIHTTDRYLHHRNSTEFENLESTPHFQYGSFHVLEK